MPSGLYFDVLIDSRCVGCERERAVMVGREILEGERTLIVETEAACECGESRVRLVVDVESC